MSYLVSRLSSPDRSDEQLDDLEAAEVAAIENSWDDSAYGVWDLEADDLVAIAYGQTVFRP